MINDLLGQTLGGRYRFEKLLGEGTFAYVFRVYDVQRRVVLAAKVLRRDIAQEPAFLERFKREAAVLARLQHPHIVRYYDTIELNDVTFILMDYIQGRTLLDILANTPEPIKPTASLVYLTPLVAALHFAHSEGVIHRDLKPANILINENGTLYVTDFGIARILNESSTLTMGGMVGTPLYMAPEQITGQPVTAATDIYALGVLTYQMVTGRLPFRGVSAEAVGSTTSERVAYEQVNVQPQRPTRINLSLNPAVEDVILRCLKKDALHRFTSVSDFYDAMAEAVGAPPITLDLPPEKQQFGPVPQRPEVTLPEWSKVIRPVPEPSEPDEFDTPAQPPTQPHLEKELQRHLSEPTIPALERVPASDYAWQPPVAYPPAAHPPARRRFPTSLLLLGLIGTVVLLVICIAGIVLIMNEMDKDDNTPSWNTTSIPSTVQGDQIAFCARRDGNQDIYVMNLNGSNLERITTAEGDERGPSWSPDGTQIAFYAALQNSSDYDIYVVNADGSNLRNLTNTPDGDDRYPSWSPDGNRIAYHSNIDGDYDIYTIQADGSDIQEITFNDVDDLGPDWSPDGTQIAFHTEVWDYPYEIATIEIETLKVMRLTDNDNVNSFPTWSPDGTQIAFHTIISEDITNIYVVSLADQASRAMTEGAGRKAFPDWSPDGTYLIYQNGADNDASVMIIPAAGGTGQPLTASDGNFLPEWKP